MLESHIQTVIYEILLKGKLENPLSQTLREEMKKRVEEGRGVEFSWHGPIRNLGRGQHANKTAFSLPKLANTPRAFFSNTSLCYTESQCVHTSSMGKPISRSRYTQSWVTKLMFVREVICVGACQHDNIPPHEILERHRKCWGNGSVKRNTGSNWDTWHNMWDMQHRTQKGSIRLLRRTPPHFIRVWTVNANQTQGERERPLYGYKRVYLPVSMGALF